MAQLKKLFLVGVTLVAGLLLTLAGFDLIEISQGLIRYTGVSLLILATWLYFFN